MTGLQALSGRPLALVRSALEMTVVLAGFPLSGTLGLGTLFFAFGIGLGGRVLSQRAIASLQAA